MANLELRSQSADGTELYWGLLPHSYGVLSVEVVVRKNLSTNLKVFKPLLTHRLTGYFLLWDGSLCLTLFYERVSSAVAGNGWRRIIVGLPITVAIRATSLAPLEQSRLFGEV